MKDLVQKFYFIFYVCCSLVLSKEICTKVEKNGINSKLEVCKTQADIEFTKELKGGVKSNLQQALCTSLKVKNKCLREILPECLSQSEVTRIELNSLHEQAQKALNNSESLGESFLDNCSIFRSRLFGKYMEKITGSTRCNYVDFTRKYLVEKKNCDEKIDSTLKEKIDASKFLTGAPRVQFLEDSFCEAYSNWNKLCTDPLMRKCFSSGKARNYRNRENSQFQTMENGLRTLNRNFSFKKSCSGTITNVKNEKTKNNELKGRIFNFATPKNI